MENKELDDKIAELSSKIGKLKSQLEPLQKERSKMWEEEKRLKKQAILKDASLTEDKVDEIANGLSRTKEVDVFFNNEVGENSECEDDGFIHVTRKGIRFCKEGHESQLQSFARNVEKAMAKAKE